MWLSKRSVFRSLVRLLQQYVVSTSIECCMLFFVLVQAMFHCLVYLEEGKWESESVGMFCSESCGVSGRLVARWSEVFTANGTDSRSDAFALTAQNCVERFNSHPITSTAKETLYSPCEGYSSKPFIARVERTLYVYNPDGGGIITSRTSNNGRCTNER